MNRQEVEAAKKIARDNMALRISNLITYLLNAKQEIEEGYIPKPDQIYGDIQQQSKPINHESYQLYHWDHVLKGMD